MRFLAVVPLALLSIGAAPADQANRSAGPLAAKSPPESALPGEILPTPPGHCIEAEPRRTEGQRLGPRRLDQLPQGRLSLTVMREVNGCPQPTIVREGYDAAPSRR